jgi:hypothetical protein
MGSDEDNLMDYFKKIKVVTVSMSYEYDPTDVLKILAEANNEVYVKEKNEDFMTTQVSNGAKEANSHSDR